MVLCRCAYFEKYFACNGWWIMLTWVKAVYMIDHFMSLKLLMANMFVLYCYAGGSVNLSGKDMILLWQVLLGIPIMCVILSYFVRFLFYAFKVVVYIYLLKNHGHTWLSNQCLHVYFWIFFIINKIYIFWFYPD